MPTLTKQELKNLEYKSMADFCKRMDQIDDINDKLKFATAYLLLHGTNGADDFTLAEAIDIARMKIADATVALRDKKIDEAPKEVSVDDLSTKVNPYAKNKNQDLELEFFMGHPSEYLKIHANKKYNELEKENSLIKDEVELQKHYLSIYRHLDREAKVDGVNISEMELKHLHLNARLEAKFGGKDNLTSVFEKTKPGFFSKLFNTTSKEAKNLDVAYKAFNNLSNPQYGNKDMLKAAADAYLAHKIPNWKPGDPLPNDNELKNLDETARSRVELSMAIIDSVDKENKSIDCYKSVVTNNALSNFTADDIENAKRENQGTFHDDLENDLDDSLSDDSDDIIIKNQIPNINQEMENEATFILNKKSND